MTRRVIPTNEKDRVRTKEAGEACTSAEMLEGTAPIGIQAETRVTPEMMLGNPKVRDPSSSH